MAISVFPVPVTSSINASSLTATTSNTLYSAALSLDPAIYTITCTTSTIANVEFYSGAGNLLTTATTASGTVAINLASAADRIRLWTNTGSNIVVTITKTAAALTDNFSGTLDTITTSSTYTQTSTSGFGYIMVVGGGGGGGGNHVPSGNGGGAGGAGGIAAKVAALTGSMSVTVGSGGAGVTGSATAPTGNAGGLSSMAGMTSNGGSGGIGSPGVGAGAGGAGGTATGGTYNLTGNSGSAGWPGGDERGGNTATSPYPFIVSGTVGTGGAARTNATGNGGGGGAGSQPGAGDPRTGGNGSPGVVYVLRF